MLNKEIHKQLNIILKSQIYTKFTSKQRLPKVIELNEGIKVQDRKRCEKFRKAVDTNQLLLIYMLLSTDGCGSGSRHSEEGSPFLADDPDQRQSVSGSALDFTLCVRLRIGVNVSHCNVCNTVQIRVAITVTSL